MSFYVAIICSMITLDTAALSTNSSLSSSLAFLSASTFAILVPIALSRIVLASVSASSSAFLLTSCVFADREKNADIRRNELFTGYDSLLMKKYRSPYFSSPMLYSNNAESARSMTVGYPDN